MPKKIIYLFLLLSITFFQFLPLITEAKDCNGLCDPLGKRSIEKILGGIIKVILGIVGSIALLMFIFGGLIWMTAGGNEQRVKKGRDFLIWTSLGLLIIFASYAILRFVFQALGVD